MYVPQKVEVAVLFEVAAERTIDLQKFGTIIYSPSSHRAQLNN